jgi:hypothetical protein
LAKEEDHCAISFINLKDAFYKYSTDIWKNLGLLTIVEGSMVKPKINTLCR